MAEDARAELARVVRRRVGWRLEPPPAAVAVARYRPRGARESGEVGRKAAPAAGDRHTWYAFLRDESGRVVRAASQYGPVEAVEWVERYTSH